MSRSDLFDFNGDGHLNFTEQALKHEVLSGGSDVTGTYGRNSGNSRNKNDATGKPAERHISTLLFTVIMALLLVLSVCGTVLTFGDMFQIMDFGSIGSALGSLIIAVPVTVILLITDLTFLAGTVIGIKALLRGEKTL